MSYLDLPRINFSGRFYTNVSTINNLLTNYPPGANIEPLWNPKGTAKFYFDSCSVTGVMAPGDNSKLLGAPVTTPKNPVVGKLVDIDPQFQQLSQVIGVTVNVSTDSGAGFQGLLEPCNFQDFWFPQPETKGIAGASNGSVTYVSVIKSVQWTDADDIDAFKLLRDATAESKLAIRFIIGSYFFQDPDDPESGFGQLLGTIAPHHQSDPPQFVRRRLMPPASAGMASSLGHDEIGAAPAVQLQACNFNLDKSDSRLSIDLANAVPTISFGGPPSDIGKLRAVVLAKDGSSDTIEPAFSFTPESYKEHGGIIDLDLTAEQCRDLGGAQAGVEQQPTGSDDWSLVLSEHRSGKYVNISQFTARVVGGNPVTYELRAFQWGEPLAGETLQLAAELPELSPRQIRAGIRKGAPLSLDVNGGSGSAVTGPGGVAVFTVTTPTELTIHHFRQQLDSLAYTISGPWIMYNGGVASGNGGLPVSALVVWAPYADAGIPNPTWEGQVQPIFDEYMRIYPGMEKILDLRKLPVVLAHLGPILEVFSLPFDNPHTMPVSRDLSPEKIAVIRTWLEIQIGKKKSAFADGN